MGFRRNKNAGRRNAQYPSIRKLLAAGRRPNQKRARGS